MSPETSRCRACEATGLEPVLDLGRTPLANRLLAADQLDQAEPTYPLELVRCTRCALLQITETVPPEVLFRDYVYFSSFSDTMLGHSKAIADRLIASRGLGPDSLVVEAASNDGYLLQYFARRGVPVLGIEPARNVAEVARDRGVPTLAEFFGEEVATGLRREGRAADVFLANNVLAHVADLGGFIRGIGILLAPDGRALIEAPYARDMIDNLEFDTIYHEHLCYFSLTALDRLFRRHGLEIVDAERIPIHGGSLRITAAHAGAAGPSAAVHALLGEEESWGVNGPGPYREFGRRVEYLGRSLRKLLSDLKGRGRRLAAYGASAKGSTLLNAFGIGGETLEFVADRSTYKQGKFTPGTRLPIVPPERLAEAMPDDVLLLTWNFADEILAQQDEYRRQGGRFIIPIPEPIVI